MSTNINLVLDGLDETEAVIDFWAQLLCTSKQKRKTAKEGIRTEMRTGMERMDVADIRHRDDTSLASHSLTLL